MRDAPELVMPAGTLEKLKFACAYGADAVYAGMPKFSLRARTNSFTESQVAEGIDYAHERGVRVYVTLNIFARNSRIQSAMKALRSILSYRPDAVILSDPGLILLAHQEFPELELHLSTQANTMNWAAVQFWKTQGITRVILPRELSIGEIKTIHEHVPDVELEVFVHGAMCVAYSGRCLLSSYFTHREANLGVCTNSCRWQYRLKEDVTEESWDRQQEKIPLDPSLKKRRMAHQEGRYALEEVSRPGERFPIEEDEHGTYILNSRDLCAIEYLRELWAAGVAGFKIEGRTKSVYYLSQTGRAYRQAINTMIQDLPFDPKVFTDIHATASRGWIPGFLIPIPEECQQNYELASPVYSTHKFGGIVRNYQQDTQLAEIEAKNTIHVGDMVEFVSARNVFSQSIQAMFDLSHRPITVAHGGHKNILLHTEQAVEPLSILRIINKKVKRREGTYGTQNCRH